MAGGQVVVQDMQISINNIEVEVPSCEERWVPRQWRVLNAGETSQTDRPCCPAAQGPFLQSTTLPGRPGHPLHKPCEFVDDPTTVPKVSMSR